MPRGVITNLTKNQSIDPGRVLANFLELLCTTILLSVTSSLYAEDDQISRGEAYYTNQYYEEAIPLLEESYQQNGDIRYARMLGHAYYQLLKFEKAAPLFIRVVATDPDDIKTRILLSDILLLQKKYPDAEIHLNFLKQFAESHEMVWVLSARLHMAKGETASAIRNYEKATNINPGRAAVFAIELLSLYIDSDNKTRASEFGRQIVEITPDAFEVVEIKTRLKQMNEQVSGTKKAKAPYTIQAGYLLELDNYLLVEPDNKESSPGYERKSDFRHVITAKATARHKLQDNLELYGNGYLYQSIHITQSKFDLSQLSLMGGLHWPLKNAGLRFPYRFSHSTLDQGFYNRSHTITPQYYLRDSKRESLHIKLKLQQSEYRDDVAQEEQRSGTKVGLELGRQHTIYKNQIFGSYRFSLDHNNSDGSNWDYLENKLSAYFSYRHSNKLTGRFSLSFGMQAFDNTHSSYGVERSDHFYNASFNISYWLDKEKELKMNTLWNDRHSNIDFYDYSRNIASFGFNWHFQ